MKPFSYSRCAVRITCCADQRNLRPASCCSVLVMNGGYGRRRYGFSSTPWTVNSRPSSRAARPRAPASSRCSTLDGARPVAGSKSRPVASRMSSTLTSVAVNVSGSPGLGAAGANVPSTSQYSAVWNAIRARSRSTTMRVATDCTRPADSRGSTFFHSTGLTS